jgi:hypothetical protein
MGSGLVEAQPLIQQHAEHICAAQPQIGLGRLHPGSIGVQAVEQLFRHSEGEDVHALVTRLSPGASPRCHGLGWRLFGHGLLLSPCGRCSR